MAILAVVLTGSLPVLSAYTQIFMGNTGAFIVQFFPLFLLGAIFGKLMDDTGSARSLADRVTAWLGPQRAIVSVVLCCALLTYGGVSAFVVAFAVYPIAAALFRAADIPKRLVPGALALGAFSFTMSALPGTPAIQNAIPMPFFGTSAFAAPGLGILAAGIMFGFGIVWLNRRASAARSAGEGYGTHDDEAPLPDVAMRERAMGQGMDINEVPEPPSALSKDRPSFAVAVLPVVAVIATNFVFFEVVFPMLETSHLSEPMFGEVAAESVRGVWSVIVALLFAIVMLIVMNWARLADLRASLDKGADASVLPIFNTASLVGFGAVIAALPVFETVTEALLAASGSNPLVSVGMSVAVLSAMTGSASGGMSIALDALGHTYVAMAQAAGVSMEAMHRATAMAAGTLDALPHNGAVITLLAVCKLSHRQAYLDVFMVAIVGPMIALVAFIAAATVFGTF